MSDVSAAACRCGEDMGAGAVPTVVRAERGDGARTQVKTRHWGSEVVHAGMATVVRASPSTVASVLSVVAAAGPATPSHTTIAPPAWLRPGCPSMPTIAQALGTYEPTQHWPEPVARTSAPCHTPSASPPGPATRHYGKPAPVGP